MNGFYFLELYPDVSALFNLLEKRGLFRQAMIDDPGYAIHLWMAEAFGDHCPKPFRLFTKRGLPAKVLAYGDEPADKLLSYLNEYAHPSMFNVCPPNSIASKKMPMSWNKGKRLDFEVLCCPAVRRNKTEKDAFLAALDRSSDPSESSDREITLDRSSVYVKWLERQLDPAAKLLKARLESFRLQPLLRRGINKSGVRTFRKIIRPSCLIKGTLQITSSNNFSTLLRRGIGRHRAFGFGMLLLRPAK